MTSQYVLEKTPMTKTIATISRLRRVKLIPSARNVALITYFKSKSDNTLSGTAILFNITNFKLMTITLGHVGASDQKGEAPP